MPGGDGCPHPLLGTMRTFHRRHHPIRPKHRQTLDRNRRSTTTLQPRKLPANLPRPLKPSSKPPKPRHPPATQRHHHPHRLHQDLRRPHRPRHPSHAPSSPNRIHHPRPNLHRKINVRPNRRNPKRKPRPPNTHNLHPLRRTTPNLRLPKPNLEPLTTRQSYESRNPRMRMKMGCQLPGSRGIFYGHRKHTTLRYP